MHFMNYWILCFLPSLSKPQLIVSIYWTIWSFRLWSSSVKFAHVRSLNNITRHFYFNHLPRLWNALPPINLDLPINIIKKQVKLFLWNYFLQNLILIIFVLTIFCAPAILVCPPHYTLWLPAFAGMPSVHKLFSYLLLSISSYNFLCVL